MGRMPEILHKLTPASSPSQADSGAAVVVHMVEKMGNHQNGNHPFADYLHSIDGFGSWHDCEGDGVWCLKGVRDYLRRLRCMRLLGCALR